MRGYHGDPLCSTPQRPLWGSGSGVRVWADSPARSSLEMSEFPGVPGPNGPGSVCTPGRSDPPFTRRAQINEDVRSVGHRGPAAAQASTSASPPAKTAAFQLPRKLPVIPPETEPGPAPGDAFMFNPSGGEALPDHHWNFFNITTASNISSSAILKLRCVGLKVQPVHQQLRLLTSPRFIHAQPACAATYRLTNASNLNWGVAVNSNSEPLD